jgi:acyl carrier protein
VKKKARRDAVKTDKEIFNKVVDAFVEALGVDDDEVTLDAKVIDDLGAESLDFLDIVFRLERSFKIKIPRGELENKVQAQVGEEPYEVDGVLTERALVQLREVMPEVPAEEIQVGLCAKDIPGLFRVATFYNICIKLVQTDSEAAVA